MKVRKFRKLPVVIDAIQFANDNAQQCMDFIGRENFGSSVFVFNGENIPIATLEGTVTASLGDWIIKGVNGEFYPCKPDIFAKTYESVEDQFKKEVYENVGKALEVSIREDLPSPATFNGDAE